MRVFCRPRRAIFFFASAAASSAYLTVSETFPLEIRALAIAIFFAVGTGTGGVLAPWLFGALVGSGSRDAVFAGYLLGAVLMLLAVGAVLAARVSAEITGATASGDPRVGAAMTLNSVAAVVLGGTALSGGTGTVVGSIVGALIIALIESLVYFVGIPSDWQNLSKGVAILLALMIGIFVSRKAKA